MKLGQAVRISATIFVVATGVVIAAGAAGARPTTPVLGGKLAYMSTRDGQADIYSMNADGSSQFDITKDGTTNMRADTEPAWSPDGTLVAFAREHADKNHGVDLMVVHSDGTHLRTLLPPAMRDGIRSSQPSWSPDGGAVVFTSNRDGNFELYVAKASGLGITQLTFTKNSVRNFEPEWSRDGHTILFARSEQRSLADVAHSNLYLLKLESGAVTQITTSPSTLGGGDRSPTWSPDGAHIAFTSDRMGSNDIYVMRSDGSDIRRLTKNSSNDNHPTWAYDNQTIAFLSDRTGATEIFTSRGTSVEPTQVTFDKARKSDPSWQKFLPIPNTGSAG